MIAETVDSFIVENGTMFMMVLSLAFSTFAFLSPLLLLSKTLTQKKKKKISVLRPQTCYLGVPSWQMLFLTVIFFFFFMESRDKNLVTSLERLKIINS